MKTLADIKKIAVLGAGTMGPGIAQMFAMGGYEVTMWTRSESTREKAKETLHKSLETFAEEDLLPKDQVEAVFNKVSFALTVEECIKGADFIQETIVENKDAKIELFKQVEACVGKDVIIASNTSGLDIYALVPERILPQMMIAHWYAPAQLIPLVEVVKGAQTPEEYAKITVDLLEKYGYCTPEDIDKAVKASFIPRAVVLGLCKRADFGGLDMTANNYKNKSYTMPPPVDMPSSLAEHVEKGELGLKTGKGFYDYAGIDKQALLAKRDKQLFEIFKVAKKFMDDPV
jgi:3-hydroxyacyl-CoA dehydrogenase